MSYFLIVFDRRRGRIVGEVTEFPPDQGGSALTARFQQELKHRGDPDIEVVVLGAEDVAALENTHSRYFGTIKDLSPARS